MPKLTLSIKLIQLEIDDSIRKSVETELIHLFNCLKIPLINQKIPNYQFKKKYLSI